MQGAIPEQVFSKPSTFFQQKDGKAAVSPARILG